MDKRTRRDSPGRNYESQPKLQCRRTWNNCTFIIPSTARRQTFDLRFPLFTIPNIRSNPQQALATAQRVNDAPRAAQAHAHAGPCHLAPKGTNTMRRRTFYPTNTRSTLNYAPQAIISKLYSIHHVKFHRQSTKSEHVLSRCRHRLERPGRRRHAQRRPSRAWFVPFILRQRVQRSGS